MAYQMIQNSALVLACLAVAENKSKLLAHEVLQSQMNYNDDLAKRLAEIIGVLEDAKRLANP